MSKFSDDLKRLILPPERGNGRLGPGRKRGAIPSAKGIAEASSGASAGVDRVEVPETRKYYTETVLASSDGLWVFEIPNVQKITYQDEDGNVSTDTLQDEMPVFN